MNDAFHDMRQAYHLVGEDAGRHKGLWMFMDQGQEEKSV